MDLVTILAATAEHGETSKTPFLVIGGILAGFAVVASAIGIMRPNLSSGASRALAGIGTVLVVVTMATMVVVS
jgi:uncharacterized membrane protein